MKRAVRAKEGIPEDQQRLIFSGRQLNSDSPLRNFGVKRNSTLQLRLRLPGAGILEYSRETHGTCITCCTTACALRNTCSTDQGNIALFGTGTHDFIEPSLKHASLSPLLKPATECHPEQPALPHVDNVGAGGEWKGKHLAVSAARTDSSEKRKLLTLMM